MCDTKWSVILVVFINRQVKCALITAKKWPLVAQDRVVSEVRLNARKTISTSILWFYIRGGL